MIKYIYIYIYVHEKCDMWHWFIGGFLFICKKKGTSIISFFFLFEKKKDFEVDMWNS